VNVSYMAAQCTAHHEPFVAFGNVPLAEIGQLCSPSSLQSLMFA
jgi:hypothetical protein